MTWVNFKHCRPFTLSTKCAVDQIRVHPNSGPAGEGLGSRMFAYASFYGIARKLAGMKTPFICVSKIPSSLDHLFEKLSLPQKIVPQSWLDERNFSKRGVNRGCCIYDDPAISNLKCDGENVLITGYRFSYKYFVDVMDEIKREFRFKKSIRRKCQNLVQQALVNNNLTEKECVTVGVHLRRGDFATNRKMNFGHSPATEEYLYDAIRFFETTIFRNGTDTFSPVSESGGCLAFLLFGNDYEWIVNVKKNAQLLRPNQSHLITIDYRKSEPAVDLCAMSLCNHMIISTGTFSWWAGFFSRGMVTYQSEYAMPNTSHFKEYVPADYFLPHWIGL